MAEREEAQKNETIEPREAEEVTELDDSSLDEASGGNFSDSQDININCHGC